MSDTDVAPGIIDFSRATPEVTTSKPAADVLLAGTPEHRTQNFFSDATGQFFAGIWESTPGKWRVRYRESEFCHITRGTVYIEDDQGRGHTFRTGDSFVIPPGFTGTWYVKEPTSKLYVIFEAASK
ncbi:MAG TPA: cupin domain-containing protein [Povalibacter sp.]|nr:cupin domain-containing protein [Povalibacter sp.]